MDVVEVPNHGRHYTSCLVARYKPTDETDIFPWCTCRLAPTETQMAIYKICSKK